MMQKIRSLEHNQPRLHQIKELENQYANICNLYINESSIMKDKLEEAAIEIAGVNALLRTMVNIGSLCFPLSLSLKKT
jgi:hypothetical protein